MSCQQSGPQGSEKRSAFRCRVSASQQESVLRAGRKQIPVRVLDESAGGFAVLANRHPGVGPDDVVRLCTESGWHEARVVHVCDHESAVAEGEPVVESEGPQFRVGLERLRDLASWEAERGLRAWFDRLGIGGFLPLFSSTVVVGVMLAVSVTAAIAAGAVVYGRMGHSGPTPGGAVGQPANSSPQAARRSSGKAHQPSEPVPGQSTGRFGSGSPVQRSSSSGPSGNAGDSSGLAATIRRLPGAGPFALKEVARELDLNESQQEEIGRIIELSGEAIGQIRVRWPGQTRQQHAERRQILLGEARRRVVELLTKEQRARWEALQGSAESESGNRM